MTTTNLKPGDVVRHPEKGNGIVVLGIVSHSPRVVYTVDDGTSALDAGLTGWERVETCTHGERLILNDYAAVKNGDLVQADYPLEGVRIISEAEYARRTEMLRPGHVQVRVDDLDLSAWEGMDEGEAWSNTGVLAIRVAKAKAAQTREDPPTVSDVERNEDSDQPVSATVSLPCPGCGEDITAGVCVERCGSGWSIVYPVSAPQPGEPDHTCQPAQPDEPQEFGARVTLTYADGTREKWQRRYRGSDDSAYAWESPDQVLRWVDLAERGTISLGWGEDQ